MNQKLYQKIKNYINLSKTSPSKPIRSIYLIYITVIGDTDFLKYKEFDYRQFETQVIWKLNKAVLDNKRDFEYISKSALISAKNIPVINHT